MVITTQLDKTLDTLSKAKLTKNQFRYKTFDSKINLNFGVFGEKNLPCIGLTIEKKFQKYLRNENFKSITIINSPEKDKQRILLILNNQNKLNIFKKLYQWIYIDLQENSDSFSSFQKIVNYINEYADLFERKILSKFSKERLIGLYGELDTIFELLSSKKYTDREIVESWNGYRSSTHDFKINNLALEIKSSLNNSLKIYCSSIDQLRFNKNFKTYLCYRVYREEKNSSKGLNIHELILNIYKKIKDKKVVKVLERKLEIFGINIIKHNTKLIRDSITTYKIDNKFPSFKDNIHDSISDVKYKLDLFKCDNWKTDLKLYEL